MLEGFTNLSIPRNELCKDLSRSSRSKTTVNLNTIFDGRGLVNDVYKDGSGSEHGISQTYKLALYLYAFQATGTYYFGEEDNLFRSQGPDGGFHTGYDQPGTYAGTLENAETTSIAMIAISTLSTTSTSFYIPPWIINLYTGLAVTAVGCGRHDSRPRAEEAETA